MVWDPEQQAIDSCGILRSGPFNHPFKCRDKPEPEEVDPL